MLIVVVLCGLDTFCHFNMRAKRDPRSELNKLLITNYDQVFHVHAKLQVNR